MELHHGFDLHLNNEVKFLWIAALILLLDPRFKKLDFFKGCEGLIGSEQRTRVAAWLRIEYNKNYKNHVSAPTEALGPASYAAGSSAITGATKHYARRKRKRESVSYSNVLASSDAEDDADDSVLTGCTNNLGAHNDELAEYTWPCRRLRTTESGEWRERSCVVI